MMVKRVQCANALLAMIGTAKEHSDPIASQDIYVIAGDMIALNGKTIHLADFEAPELGRHAHCGLEQMLAARATSRLRPRSYAPARPLRPTTSRMLMPTGTEGTRWCNYGRTCECLSVDGRNVGDIPIAENLAHALMC